MKVSKRMIFLVTTVIFVCSATLASAQVWNHDPSSTLGPNRWGKLVFPFATCGAEENATFVEVGKKQAPVDIVPAETVAAALPELEFQYRSTPFVAGNTGHVVEVPYEPGSVMRVGKEKYELLQFHFHAPSEHAVNGQFAAAELHLVHRNQLLDLAVVGVLVQVGAPVNRVIDKILRNASTESGKEVDLGGDVNARTVLPRHSERYYHYSGSLTTPPCSEGVRWFVLKEPVFVSQEAIDHLHGIISEFANYGGFSNNNRPVRPLNGRVILRD